MRNQTLGIALSAGLHGVFISAAFFMGYLFPPPTRPMLIDFNVSSAPAVDGKGDANDPECNMPPKVKTNEAVRQAPAPKAAIKESLPAPIHVQQAMNLQEESPVAVPVDNEPSGQLPVGKPAGLTDNTPTTIPVNDGDASSGGQRRKAASPFNTIAGNGDSAEDEKKRYLKEHFAYIREMIIKNISYPYMARKRGMEGKVIVSFVVCEKGLAHEIRIVESSGYEILDKNAMETIKKVSPFPKPPVRAEIVMPIVYRMI